MPDVMIRQAASLAGDLRSFLDPFDLRVREGLAALRRGRPKKAYVIGAGDSHHAACASKSALRVIGRLDCDVLTAQSFLDYPDEAWRPHSSAKTLLIAISASGNTPSVIQAVRRAREGGMTTLGLCGKRGTGVTEAAHHAIVLELGHNERSPGIRTYQAALLGLMLIAIRLGELHATDCLHAGGALRAELLGLAETIEATCTAVEGRARRLASRIANTPALVVLGSGPSYGTARFSAAKMMEGAGVLAVGEQLEEWWHGLRFTLPADVPIIVIAPPGRSHWRAAALAAAARDLGRPVIAVAQRGDSLVRQHVEAVFTVEGELREEFSPLVYHLFSSYLASHWAVRLDRHPFRTDRPASFHSADGWYIECD